MNWISRKHDLVLWLFLAVIVTLLMGFGLGLLGSVVLKEPGALGVSFVMIAGGLSWLSLGTILLYYRREFTESWRGLD